MVTATKSPFVSQTPQGEPPVSNSASRQRGALIVNADDWGRDRENTDRILDCARVGAVSAVSAMVFMEDSERAAALANEERVDAGLHLNFTTKFSGRTNQKLADHHQRVSRFLLRNRMAQVIFHPGLTNSFAYVVASQIEEFRRLYGIDPNRVDGHHHMHLCANVLLTKLLPARTTARRNFSFVPGEKSGVNRLYRKFTDSLLARRHRMTDFFYSLAPVKPAERLQKIFLAAHCFTVELETHPVNQEEYDYLTRGEMRHQLGELIPASHLVVSAANYTKRIDVDD